jgi:hypothetical protein
MKGYNYSSITGEFLSEEELRLNPLESELQKKDIFLIPASCTTKKPLKVKDGEINIFDGEKWNIQKQKR